MKKSKNIYLAGKIQHYNSDWRNRILTNSEDMNRQPSWTDHLDDHVESVIEIKEWGINYGVVMNEHNYTGPYFISCDHGCFHGDNSHGVGVFDGGEFPEENEKKQRQKHTVELCKKSIEKSDIIFAWIEDSTCYGTLVEIGYAKSLNKTIYIAGASYFEDLWFAYTMADKCNFNFTNPEESLKHFLNENQ